LRKEREGDVLTTSSEEQDLYRQEFREERRAFLRSPLMQWQRVYGSRDGQYSVVTSAVKHGTCICALVQSSEDSWGTHRASREIFNGYCNGKGSEAEPNGSACEFHLIQ